VSCDEIRGRLPDHVLGTLPEAEQAAVRRHVRGCAVCRAEAEQMDHGLALFGSVAHEVDPPPELEERVLNVLTEEWREPAEAPVRAKGFRRFSSRFLIPMAAAFVLLAGALGWAGVAQSRANTFREDSATYQRFLHALGGKDVRVATLKPAPGSSMTGSAILYDSDIGQSWVLVLVRSPGATGAVDVTLSGPNHPPVSLFPMKLDPDGDGAAWLVTSSNISGLRAVRLTDSSGTLVASGIAQKEPA
jgi:putative zinc finger protein